MSDWYKTIYGNDNKETPAYGWIQWKGTDVCVDLHCICGTHGHVDGDFMYTVKCTDCGRKYAVGQTIKLIPLDTPELVKAHNKYHNDYYPFNDENTVSQEKVNDVEQSISDTKRKQANPQSNHTEGK